MTPDRIHRLREVARDAIADRWKSHIAGMLAVAEAAGALPEALDTIDALRVELERTKAELARVRTAAREAADVYQEIGLLTSRDKLVAALEVSGG